MDNDNDQLMTPAEVAEAFRVDTATVTRWARAGLLNPVFTLGGHRRYRASEISDRLR
ncbi:BldC family transcriptional regulator [Terrabacter aeriphilus]